jgi:hypothetical protein
MKNKLTDVHNHLMETMEWLMDREITGEALVEQINRANAVCKVAQHIVDNGNLAVNAAKAVAEWPELRKLSLFLE